MPEIDRQDSPIVHLSKLGIRKPQYLHKDEGIRLLESVATPLRLIQSVAIELCEQNAEIVRIALEERGGGVKKDIQVLADLAQRSLLFERGDRIANGMHIRLTQTAGRDSYGKYHHRVREDPKRHDHATPHSRRHKMLEKMLLYLFPRIPKNPPIIFGMALFSKNHDSYQLDATAWNAEKAQFGIKIPSKALHQEYGAVEIGAQEENYFAEAGVRMNNPREVKLAKDALHFAQLMILFHDRGSKFINMANASVCAYRHENGGTRPISRDELFRAIQEEKLDWFTISNRQLIQIVQHFQTTDRFPSLYGLHPQFENDFITQLQKMEADDTPFFEHISKKDREEFVIIASLPILADILDMIYPPREALLRKLNVEIAAGRPLFSSGTTAEFMHFVFDSDGENAPSDYWRTSAEFGAVIQILQQLPIEHTSRLYKSLQKMVIIGYLHTREVFLKLMAGDSARDYLKNIYADRIYSLGQKSLKKAEYSDRTIREMREQYMVNKHISLVEVEDIFLQKLQKRAKKEEVKRIINRMHTRMDDLIADYDTTIARLLKKPNNQNPKELHKYSDTDYEVLDSFTHDFLDEAALRLDMSRDELHDLITQWRKNRTFSLPGLGVYDNIGQTWLQKVNQKSTLHLLNKIKDIF